MIAIADSGSTKTLWVVSDGKGQEYTFKTIGFNPTEHGMELARYVQKVNKNFHGGISLYDLYAVNVTGIVTGNDKAAIASSREELVKRMTKQIFKYNTKEPIFKNKNQNFQDDYNESFPVQDLFENNDNKENILYEYCYNKDNNTCSEYKNILRNKYD